MAHVGRSTGELLLGIQSRATQYGSLLDAPSSARPMRYSSLSLKDLVCLCAGPRDDEAWEEFVSRVQKPIALTIMRRVFPKGEPSRSLVEDLVMSVASASNRAPYLRMFAVIVMCVAACGRRTDPEVRHATAAVVNEVLAELPRSTTIGEPHGLWWKCETLGEKLYINKRFHKDVRAADELASRT